MILTENNIKLQTFYYPTVKDVLTRHCEECGIFAISIYGLRHTHASLFLFAGVSIASVAHRLEKE